MSGTFNPQMDESTSDRISIGVPGINEILNGGLIPSRSYLVRGNPGTGKTILGLHYLTTGTTQDETSLYINLEETTADIKQNAASLDFDLEAVHFLDLSPKSEFFAADKSYDLFESGEVERDPMIKEITEKVTELEPDRVFVDPLTQLRYLATDDYQFRKQTLSFMRLLSEQGATVLFTTQATSSEPDIDLQFMSDGTIELEYTSNSRTIAVPKLRGSATRSGKHALKITDEGLVAYPKLMPGQAESEFVPGSVSSGIPELDALLEGGLTRGTATVISGPTGVGKTTTGTQLMKEAAGRGERSVIYLFEETVSTFKHRSEAINIPVAQMIEQGTLSVKEVESLRTSPQEFAQDVRHEVEENGTDIVMIDGIVGYKHSLKGDEENLVTDLHALVRYLKNGGVTVLLIDEVANIISDFQATNDNISYLADNIIFLRHLEVQGQMRKVIGVLKMRTSDFERTIREFAITEHGITVGEPRTDLQGILSGTPEQINSGE